MQVICWKKSILPEEKDLRARMQRDGLTPYAWSNGPEDYYAAHTHSYEKVLYCVRGSIRFIIHHQHPVTDNETKDYVELNPGDCLILPSGVCHSARVGPHGVTCLESARYTNVRSDSI